MRKIAVFLTKGGVGKTTTAITLAAGRARQGATVLLIDTDTQGHVSAALGLQPPAGLAALLAGERTTDEGIVEARARLWLLAGGGDLTAVKRPIARQNFCGEQTLSEALGPLGRGFDYVILDTAPGWGPGD